MTEAGLSSIIWLRRYKLTHLRRIASFFISFKSDCLCLLSMMLSKVWLVYRFDRVQSHLELAFSFLRNSCFMCISHDWWHVLSSLNIVNVRSDSLKYKIAAKTKLFGSKNLLLVTTYICEQTYMAKSLHYAILSYVTLSLTSKTFLDQL